MNWDVIGVMRQGRMRIGVFVVLALLDAGCGSIPLPYEKVKDSPIYIGEDYLATVVAEGRTRDEVIASLGPPDAQDEELRAIGYQRCIESESWNLELIFFVPVPYKGNIANCQLVVIWFNEEGRAAGKRTDTKNYTDEDYTDEGHDLGRRVRSWAK